MAMKNPLKTVLMTATLCALGGLANSASAATCFENDGRCQSAPVNAGADRKVSYRCTINIPYRPDLGNCKIVEVATGRFPVNRNFRGDTGNRLTGLLPTRGAYRCVVEAVGPDRGAVYCRIN